MIPYILTDRSVTVLYGGRSVAIPASAANFADVVTAIQNGDDVALAAAIDQKQAVVDFTSGRIEIRDRILYYAGQPLDTNLTRKILEFKAAGDERLAQPLMSFLDKVMENPSNRAVRGLYDWVAASGMPIHPDGDILAWKIVKDDFFDYRTGTFDHTPGNVVEMPRNMCDEDPDVTCSTGIHFCSFSYLPHYHNENDRRVLLVKINPRDVVAIPKDYNISKGRCCRLEVIEQVPTPEEFFPTTTVYWGDEEALIDFEIEEVAEPCFKVGQRWEDSDGDVHTVTEVDEDEETVTTEYEGQVFVFDLDGLDLESSDFKLIQPVEDESFLPLEVGKTYLTRDGRLSTVIKIEDYGDAEIADTSMEKCLFAKTGRANDVGDTDRPYDIVAAFDPQVGDRYETRGGEVREVTEIMVIASEVDIIRFGVDHTFNVFASNGKQRREAETEHDLVRRVS